MNDEARDQLGRSGGDVVGPATRQRMQQLFAKLVGDNDAYASRLDISDRGPGPLTEEDLEDLLCELRMGITARQARALDPHPPQAPVRVAMQIRDEDAHLKFELDEDAVHRPCYFRLRNQGPTTLHVYEMTCNGEGMMGESGIRNWIAAGEPSSAREVAFGLYLFCRRHQVHGPPPVAHWDDTRIQDPVRFHTGFGYGLCGHSAHAFMGLCRLFGLRARIRGIRGHTFPEVYHEGAWHVVDPNGETWYPCPADPQRLLSLSDLTRVPESYWDTVHFRPLGRGKTHEDLYGLLRDRERHRTVVEVDGRPHASAESPLIDLQPGESLTLHYETRGPWAAPREDAAWLAPFVPPRNVRLMSVTRSVRGAEFCTASDPKSVQFEYSLAQGWAAHDLKIDARPTRPDSFSDVPPKVWLVTSRRRLGPFRPVAPGCWRLRRGFAGLDDDETATLVRMECARDTCAGFELDVSYQYSVFAFPIPRPGTNILRVSVGTARGMPDAEAELGVAMPESGDPGGRPRPVAPHNAVILQQGEGLVFRWTGSVEGVVRTNVPEESSMPHVIEPTNPIDPLDADGYELLVTRSERPFDLASPSLHRFVHGAGTLVPWNVVNAHLGAGRFHWRVRRVDADHVPLGRWSKSAAFNVTIDQTKGGTNP